jgi:hypothetical protein
MDESPFTFPPQVRGLSFCSLESPASSLKELRLVSLKRGLPHSLVTMKRESDAHATLQTESG